MDEPLAALDAQTRRVLQEELLRIWGQQRKRGDRKTIIYVTHSIEEAVFLSDRVGVMSTSPGRLKEIVDIRHTPATHRGVAGTTAHRRTRA